CANQAAYGQFRSSIETNRQVKIAAASQLDCTIQDGFQPLTTSLWRFLRNTQTLLFSNAPAPRQYLRESRPPHDEFGSSCQITRLWEMTSSLHNILRPRSSTTAKP